MTSSSNMLWDLLDAHPHDEESIMQCLYDHPDCCFLVIDDKLAIHVAIEQCLSMDIIKQMLICYPACCSRKNKRDHMLLHELLHYNARIDHLYVIELVINGSYEAVRSVDGNGNLPLHLECMNSCRSDVIVKLHDAYPDAINMYNEHSYPLHYVISNQHCSSEVVMYIINACPEVVRRVTSSGRLPLHIECYNHCRYDVVIKLLDIYPGAVSIADKKDCYPLHDALTNDQSSTEVIMQLISLYPAAVRQTNADGNLPIHIYCKYHCRCDILAKLLDVYPEAISICDIIGKLPLHIVLLRWRHPPIPMIQLLLDRYPDAVKKPDHTSWLPVYRIFNAYYDLYVSYSSKQAIEYKELMLSMINIYPTSVTGHHISIYLNPILNKPVYRILLLLASDHVFSYDHDHDQDHIMHEHYGRYVDMNKKYRYPFLYLILQLSSLSSTPQQVSNNMLHTSVHHTSMLFDAMLCRVLLHMMSAAGKWLVEHSYVDHDNECEMSYGWMKGDDLGSMLLRKVVYYL